MIIFQYELPYGHSVFQLTIRHLFQTHVFLLTLCMLGNFSCFCCPLLGVFFFLFFFKKSFQELNRVSNSLDPDQDWCCVEHMQQNQVNVHLEINFHGNIFKIANIFLTSSALNDNYRSIK